MRVEIYMEGTGGCGSMYGTFLSISGWNYMEIQLFHQPQRRNKGRLMEPGE